MRRSWAIPSLGLAFLGCSSDELTTTGTTKSDAGTPVPTATATSTPKPPLAPAAEPDASTLSSDGGPKACFSACGGNPTGLWRLDSTCFADLTGGCKSGVSSANFDVTSASGLLLASDSYVSLQLATSTRAAIHYAAECAAMSSAKAPSSETCQALATAILDTKTIAAAKLLDSSCVYSSTAHACDCGYTTTLDFKTLNTPYRVSGNILTYTTPEFKESLEYCVNGDTLTFRPTVVHDVGVDLAYVFKKATPTCAAQVTYCDGDAVRQCDDFGTASTFVKACASGETCAYGICGAPLCTPSMPACDGAVSTTCDAEGKGYTGPQEDCGAKGLACSPGAGCVATTQYDIGQSNNCFDVPSSIGRMVGNFYQAKSDARLVQIESYLDVPAATLGTFAVYEAPAIDGPYTNVFRLKHDVLAGKGFHSSGPVNVSIRAGYYYGIFVMPDAAARPCSFNPGNTFAGFGYYAGSWFHADPKTATADSFSDYPGSAGVFRQRLTVAAAPAKDAGPPVTLPESGVP